MRGRLAACALTAGLALLALSGAKPGDAVAPPVAIVDAWVVDGSGATPVVATVILREGKIAAVGPRLPIPPGARVIAADGMTLTPGFFDLHEHVPYAAVRKYRGDWLKNLYACLVSGVTTVVDFGRDPESFAEVRRILAKRPFQTPRVLLAARFAVPGGHGAELGRDWFSSLAVTPAQATAAFQEVIPQQPDALKLFTDGWRYGAAAEMAGMPEETVRQLTELAHRRGIPTLTHTVTLEKAKEAARAGVDVLAHAVSDQAVDAELIGLLRARGACYAPTMAVYEPAPPDFRASWTETLLEPSVRDRIPALRPDAKPPNPPSESALARWANIVANNRALREAGVKVALGTDAGVVGTYHGWAVLRELELLVESGMTPLEALRAATATSAECLGVADDRGSIQPGKRADLVLIEGKPHTDIRDVWNVRRVFLDGREIERGKLIEAIQNPNPIVPDVSPAPVWIDDFESEDGRARTGALWRADFEAGQLTTAVAYDRIGRSSGDHCLSALIRFAANPEPFARLTLPLSRGGVAVVDATAFEGLDFEARGDGKVRLTVETLEVRDGDDFGFEFETGPEWNRFRVPFSELRRSQAEEGPGLNLSRLLSIGFRLDGQAGGKRHLEIDNLKFIARGEDHWEPKVPQE